MKKIRAVILCLSLLPSLFGAGEFNLLEEDWESAVSEARETGKCLYVAFLGDGWSVSSKRFKEEILDTKAFRKFAGDRLIYCPVLARRTPKLTKGETAHLQALVIHLDIKSYPAIVLLAPDGKEILRHGYREESPEAYLALLEAIIPGGLNPGPGSD